MQNIIFVHGLESSGHGFIGRFLKNLFPNILTPDFKKANDYIPMYELLKYRMVELKKILRGRSPWTLIGSSLGGLMVAIYALENPNRVSQLVLLAPF